MAMAPSRALRGLALAGLCGGPLAWSSEGHSKIAHVAESLLKGKHRDQVRTMLHSDLVDLANWEEKTMAEMPTLTVTHYHRQQPEWTCDTGLGIKGSLHCDGKEAEYDSLLCAVAGVFRRYAHDALLREFPKPQDTIWPHIKGSYHKVIDWWLQYHPEFKPMFTSKVIELRWFVMLLGDVHQPLHWLRQHDYGREIQVVYKGEEYSLLNFWEDFLPRHLPPPPPQRELDREYAEHSKAWSPHVPTELFRDWAREAAELACRGIYSGLEVNHNDGSRTIPSRVELSEQTVQGWIDMASRATVLGGQRLAFVMLDLIEHRRHALALKEGRGHRHRHTRYWENFGTNAAFAAFLVPAWLLALRWHERRGGPSLRQLILKYLEA